MKRPPPSVRSIVFSLIIALIVTAVYLAGIFEKIENLSYDAALRLGGEQPRDSSLILVTVDESSLDKMGRWPWPRSVMARILEAISEGTPATIGFDIGFFEPDRQAPHDDERLIAAAEKSGRVIFPVYLAHLHSLGEIVSFQKPFAGLAGAAAGLGHVHIEPSLDGVVRKVYLHQECGGESAPAFAVKCVESYLSRTGKDSTVRFTDNGIEIGDIFIPTVSRRGAERDETSGLISQDHMIYIRFAGPGGTFLSLPAWKVLEDNFPRRIFKDKIVLIGATAAGLGDVSITPFSTERRPMPGVEIQANIINTILTENYITRTTPVLMTFGIILVSLITGWLFYRLGTRGASLAFLGMLLAMVGIYLLLLFRIHLWLELWPLLAVILINYLVATARKFGFLFRSLGAEIKTLNRIQKFAPPLPQSPDEEEFFHTFFTFLSSILKIDTAFLLIFDPAGKKLTLRRSWGIPPPLDEEVRIPPPAIFTDLNQPRQVNCTEKECPFLYSIDCPRNCLIFPLPLGNRKLGFLVVGRIRRDPFQENELATGEIISYHLSHAIQKLDAYSRALGTTESSIHFFHPGGMERKIENLNLLSQAMTYEQILLISMLGSITDGVIVADLIGNILLANPRAREILQIAEEEARQLNIIKLLQGLLNISEDELRTRFHRLLAGRESFTREITVSSQTYLLSLISFRREEGIPGGIMAVFTDVTYLKELDKLRAETMAMLTHEIKNPLGGIMGFCDLFVEGALGPEETKEYIHLIKKSVTGLHKLVIEYLESARLESGAVELNLAHLDLPIIVAETISLLTPRAEEQEIRIELNRPDRIPAIKGDADMLRRVCGNLIGNAVKYSPSGTEITVSLSQHGDEVVMEVADRGYGIPEEDREKVFQKFFRSKQTQKITGTGLGLAITKEIVERHGGTIRVKARKGGGSIFAVTLKCG
jgi:PAS domain S-box-containing protein